MSNNDFYRAFEDKHRGSRELIRNRVSVYLPFVLALKKIYPNVEALDIGCGRGEWIELLKENSILEKGIDLDEGMLKACHILNLNVEQDNGIEYLKKQKNESKIIVSTFHVVEHISFGELQQLVSESLRVLKPGGILIMETPNPENIKVATETFYLDPTHIKPIPSNLLSFLPEFYGYTRTKVLRLQESKELSLSESANLLQVIEGASPDYAVVAQKEANKDILEKFDQFFEQDFGLSLGTLADKFENRLKNIEAKASKAETKASKAEIKASEAETKASEAETKASEAELRTNDAFHHYHMVVNSNSWKIMKPYRLMGNAVRWFVTGVKHWLIFSPTSRPRRILRKALVSLKYCINTYPKLKKRLMRILNLFPGLKAKLKKIEQAPHTSTGSFINKYQFKPLSPRTEKLGNQNNMQNLSIDEILQRIEVEVQKQEKKDTKR